MQTSFTQITPCSSAGHTISQSAQANSSLCYACGSCLVACPVNLATDRLQPRKLVMMANFGLFEELLVLPEIWYCLSCKSCNHACPMTVKPATLIAHLRMEAVRRGVIRKGVVNDLVELQRQLQRMRLRLVTGLLAGEGPVLLPGLGEMPEDSIRYPAQELTPKEAFADAGSVRKACGTYLGYPTNLSDCFTCSECRNACPVCRETAVFDPMWMIRMISLGFAEDLLRSPMMWLCIQCESCTRACTQRVRVHLFIRRIQQLALQESVVNATFIKSWKLAQAALYSWYIGAIDKLLTAVSPLPVNPEQTLCEQTISKPDSACFQTIAHRFEEMRIHPHD
jgi:heterodisulfide reductase subunit C